MSKAHYYVKNSSKWAPLIRHLELEGVTRTEDKREALVDLDSLMGESIGPEALSHLDLLVSTQPADFFLSRWWNGTQWHPQTFLGLPLVGLWNDGLSVPETSGVGGCWVKGEVVEKLFSQQITELVRELKWKGFVSIMLSNERRLCSLCLGVPGSGLYNILEGSSKSLITLLSQQEDCTLLESYTMSLVVSRAPFPFEEQSDLTEIGNVTNDLERHFWLGEHNRFKEVVTTTSTFLGVATAWGSTFKDACQRVVGTCWNLRCPEIQFRTDGWWALRDRLFGVRDSLLCDSESHP